MFHLSQKLEHFYLSRGGEKKSLMSLYTSVVKNPAAKQEKMVPPLGQEDALEKEMATHSCILA